MQGCQWVAGTGWRALRGAPRMSVPGQAVRPRSLAGLSLQSLLFLAATALALVFPFVADSYATYVALLIAYQVITVTGLSLLMGYTGQGSIAHPGFAAIGGYVSTLLMLHAGWPFWVAAPATGLLAGLVGYLLGFPALRLSGHYLLLVTLGFLQIVQVVLVSWGTWTGGPAGLKAVVPVFGSLRLSKPESLYWLIIPVTFVMVILAFNIVGSRIGRAFTAIRDNPIAAAAVGINVAHYKTLAFGISAFYAGIAGALYAPLVGFLDPLEFTLWIGVAQITFLVVGGMYSLWGAILGAVLLTALPELLRPAQEYREIGFGILLLGFLLFAPTGIVGRFSSMLARRRGRDPRPHQVPAQNADAADAASRRGTPP